MKIVKITHEQLLVNLADRLERSGHIAIPNLQLGSSWAKEYGEKLPGRVDIMCFRTVYRNKMPRVFEIKVSRKDLLQDIRSGKWRKYLPFCEYMVFAFPTGLAAADEIPAECGIWLWNQGKKSWSCWRRGQRSEPTGMGEEFWFATLLNQKSRVDRKLLEIRAEEMLIERGHAGLTRTYYSLTNINMSGLSSRIKTILKENYRLKTEILGLKFQLDRAKGGE